MDNDWTRRIRELEAENTRYQIIVRELKAQRERQEFEIEALKKEVRGK